MTWVAPDFRTRHPLHVVTLDDFRPTDYSRAYPYLRSKGVAGTSYIITDRARDTNWHNVREMYRGGWDCQCHTYSHEYLWDMTEAQLREQMQLANTVFEEERLPAPEHIAYPFGAYNALVQEIIGEYRLTQRRVPTLPPVDAVATYDSLEYDAIEAVNGDLASQQDLEATKMAIDKAAATNGIVVTMTHSLVDAITDSSQCLFSLFQAMVEYSLSRGVRVVSVAQMYNTVAFHRLIYGGVQQ